MKERHSRLLDYVMDHGKTEVSVLAAYLEASKVTVRKDLEYLSEKGLLKRERGYALPDDPGDIHYQMAFHLNDKQRIAKAAAELVADGETVIIEAGSTCALFAEELAKARTNVSIITNSLYLATYIQPYTNVNLVLLGGTLQPNGQALVGPLTKEAVSAFHVDKIFLGTDGYSREKGFTGEDMIRSETLACMRRSANRTYVLTVSEKFARPGSVLFLDIADVYQIITDQGIDPGERDYLTGRGVRVTAV